MTDSGGPERATVVIRKYANRRLYDTSRSRYVTLDDLAALVHEGARVRVVEARSGADITRQVLAQIILEAETGETGLLDEETLRELIRLRAHPARARVSESLGEALAALVAGDRPATARHTRPGTAGDRPGRAEAAQLSARIDALQARLEKLIARDRPRRN